VRVILGLTATIARPLEPRFDHRIFLTLLTVIGVGTLTLENLPKAVAQTSTPIANNIGTDTSMAVVVIRAPRAKERI
jgi:hypothetical protein